MVGGVPPLRTVLGHDLVDLADHFLPVAQHEAVHEVGQGLGVERAVTAGQHDGVVRRSVRTVEGHRGQVDQVEDVGVHQLGRQVEGQDVEGASRKVVLEREERHLGGTHGRLHVHPRGVRPLGDRVVTLVEDLVEDLQALIGQPDLVGVGVDEQPRHRPAPMLGRLGAQLPADIPCRLRDLGQQRLDLWPERLHLPFILGGPSGGSGPARSRAQPADPAGEAVAAAVVVVVFVAAGAVGAAGAVVGSGIGPVDWTICCPGGMPGAVTGWVAR